MPKKRSQKSPPPAPRKRLSIDEKIAAIQAKILTIQEREAQKQAKADPALRHVAAATRALEKALELTEGAATKRVLEEARSTLAELTGAGRGAVGGRARRSPGELSDLSDALLTYVRNNPGQRGEEIAAAMATDSGTIRPVMKRLIEEGKVTTEGQRRGMIYSPA